jgi:hypothetical protein
MIRELIRQMFFRTCRQDGCGYMQPNPHDEKCAICRLPMGDTQPNGKSE